jgi:hypothetical protein
MESCWWWCVGGGGECRVLVDEEGRSDEAEKRDLAPSQPALAARARTHNGSLGPHHRKFKSYVCYQRQPDLLLL